MTPFRRRSWLWARRGVQWGFLALFLFLFFKTRDDGAGLLHVPADFFFQLDPLAAASASLSSMSLVGTVLPAAGVIILTVLLGRVFCGWYCPLGTILDTVHALTGWATRPVHRWARGGTAKLRPVRYGLLIVVLLAAALGVPLVSYLDPFALLTRGLGLWGMPAWGQGLQWTASESAWFKAQAWWRPLLPDKNAMYALSWLTGGMLLLVILLEVFAQRFWCRYLCPLGGMLGLLSRWSFVRRLPHKTCAGCKAAEDCGPRCRMDAFGNADHHLAPESCTLCMDCLDACPQDVPSVKVVSLKQWTAKLPPQPDLSRRAVLASMALGVAAPVLARAGKLTRPAAPPDDLLRPPGVGNDEAAFLNRCIQCGLCLKVCPTAALQPAGLESGMEGLFSPRMMPALGGYCEINCNLCGQVCPTGAIPPLPLEAKQHAVMGLAKFNHKLCLPWASNDECLVCEEHCPLGDKAIAVKEVEVDDGHGTKFTVHRPYVIEERCIGCGICESKCPLREDGEAAIRVFRAS